MPRKKPYSSKQKKRQLQEKRRRKQEEGSHYGSRSDSEDSGNEERKFLIEKVQLQEKEVTKINEQPGYQTDRKLDPNRYRLHFFKESKHELERRKEESRKAYQSLPEEALEMDMSSDSSVVIEIPKRPPWDYNLSKHQLELNEEKYFRAQHSLWRNSCLELWDITTLLHLYDTVAWVQSRNHRYVDSLFSKYDPQELSYFEMNLETWRQLWRVLEMSDIFLLITDIRYPSLGFSPALYHFITSELQKSVIIVLNKADLALPSLVIAWQHYFKVKFPEVGVVCFTSFPKDEQELGAGDATTGLQKKRKRGTYRALGPRELYKLCCHLVNRQVDLSSWEAKIEEDQDIGYHDDSSEEDESGEATTEHLDCSYQEHTGYKDGILTIGCIGYPNVGKSSVMNGLVGKKVVSVSRTPGHTKHFQTIFLTPTVRLCDSPGLVFPSRVDKNLQIVGGIYPISQVREPYTTIGYIAQRLDIPRLLKLTHPEKEEGRDVKWTAYDICYAWAEKRGYLTAKAARPDTYRAANQLLRMTVTGQLCLCFTPKDYTKNKDYWMSHPETQDFKDLQIKYRKKPGATAEDSVTEDSSSEEELEQGSELSENEEDEGLQVKGNTKSKQSFVSSNPFALLEDD